MDSRPLPFAPIVVCASSERGGYRYLALTVTWSASLAHSQVTAPSELSRSRLPALLARPSLGSSSLGDRERFGGGCGGRCGFESPAVPRLCRRARPAAGVRWNCDAAPTWPCPPAWWVGRGLAIRSRAVTPHEWPEDPPARGDRHPARLGLRQGPYLYLLAEARRLLSVHRADLRLALPGLPHLGRVPSIGVRGCPRHPDGRAQPAAASSFTSSGSGSLSPSMTRMWVLASDSALLW